MSVFTLTHRVRNADVDANGRLRWDTMFTLFQEASFAHFAALGAGRDRTIDRGLLWVIALQSVQISRLPGFGEELRVQTWNSRTLHTFFTRCFRIRDEGGAVLAEGCAFWALIDSVTRRPVVPGEVGIELPAHVEADTPPLPRTFPRCDCEPVGSYTVPFSVLDSNRHMNNTRYLNLAQDWLPREATALTPRAITVEYCGEARWGDEIALFRAKTSTGWYLRGDSIHPVFRMLVAY